MRLLLDEHVDKTVAARLRARGFDVVAVTERGDLLESPDADLLEHAFGERRAVVTYDVADFRVEVTRRTLNELGHLGIVLLNARRFPQGKRYVGALVAALEQLLEEMPAENALEDREIWLWKGGSTAEASPPGPDGARPRLSAARGDCRGPGSRGRAWSRR